MPFIDNLTVKVTDRLPSMISPGIHAFVDLATASAFIAFAATSWKRDERAAITAGGLGLFHLLSSALTDYSGQRLNRTDADHHARIDLGLAAMTASAPTMMGLKDKKSIGFFRWQAVLIAAVAGLTDFRRTGENKQLSRIDKELKQRKAA
jgi:hypothetical protein